MYIIIYMCKVYTMYIIYDYKQNQLYFFGNRSFLSFILNITLYSPSSELFMLFLTCLRVYHRAFINELKNIILCTLLDFTHAITTHKEPDAHDTMSIG